MNTLMHHTKARPMYIKNITENKKNIGYIHIVKYNLGKNSVPHLEYHLDEAYRGKGIMQKELSKYLKNFPKYEYFLGDKLVAVVLKTNNASIHLLEKMNFAYFNEVEDFLSYVWSSKFSLKQISDVIHSIRETKGQNHER